MKKCWQIILGGLLAFVISSYVWSMLEPYVGHIQLMPENNLTAVTGVHDVLPCSESEVEPFGGDRCACRADVADAEVKLRSLEWGDEAGWQAIMDSVPSFPCPSGMGLAAPAGGHGQANPEIIWPERPDGVPSVSGGKSGDVCRDLFDTAALDVLFASDYGTPVYDFVGGTIIAWVEARQCVQGVTFGQQKEVESQAGCSQSYVTVTFPDGMIGWLPNGPPCAE